MKISSKLAVLLNDFAIHASYRGCGAQKFVIDITI